MSSSRWETFLFSFSSLVKAVRRKSQTSSFSRRAFFLALLFFGELLLVVIALPLIVFRSKAALPREVERFYRAHRQAMLLLIVPLLSIGVVKIGLVAYAWTSPDDRTVNITVQSDEVIKPSILARFPSTATGTLPPPVVAGMAMVAGNTSWFGTAAPGAGVVVVLEPVGAPGAARWLFATTSKDGSWQIVPEERVARLDSGSYLVTATAFNPLTLNKSASSGARLFVVEPRLREMLLRHADTAANWAVAILGAVTYLFVIVTYSASYGRKTR